MTTRKSQWLDIIGIACCIAIVAGIGLFYLATSLEKEKEKDPHRQQPSRTITLRHGYVHVYELGADPLTCYVWSHRRQSEGGMWCERE